MSGQHEGRLHRGLPLGVVERRLRGRNDSQKGLLKPQRRADRLRDLVASPETEMLDHPYPFDRGPCPDRVPVPPDVDADDRSNPAILVFPFPNGDRLDDATKRLEM